ncbi:uncharacterized protein LOC107858774 isoform X1 [Capsicum annuum]|uniref:uncharacterized protein LOC107858774 isoform X1 n=1 Tax=Capsicum annuum TaxID=4072 RepID=UPI001FB0D61A|nr:uncharacterized protein LOC107858774 isoform X1 [Capsicum annuum]
MASLSRFLYQNLFFSLATVFAFVSLYVSPVFNFITTFVVHRLRRCKALLNKNWGFKDEYRRECEFPETGQQLDYESDDVFQDVSEFADSENNEEKQETEFNFTFKFPTYEEFRKSKEDKGEYVKIPSTFNINKSLTEAKVVEAEDSKEVDSKIEAINEEGGHGFKWWKQPRAETQRKDAYSRPFSDGPSLDLTQSGSFNALDCPLNVERKGDLINLECDKEEMEKTEETNSIKGESVTENKQILEESDEFLFQSEKDSCISTDSDSVSIGFDHVCYLMNKLVDSYSDGFLTDEDFGGEFLLDDALNDHEMSQESDDDDNDSDIMEELRKLELEQDQPPQFPSVDDFYEHFDDSENAKSINEDANKLETLWEHQELIEQLKMELRKVRDTGLPTIFEESDTPKMDDLEPWKIDEKLQREDCISELQKFYKSYRERMRKFDILTYQKMYAIGYLQKDPLKDPFQHVSRQRCSGPKLKSLISKNIKLFKHKRNYDNIDPIVKFIKELQSDLEVIYVGQMCLCWEFLHWQYDKALSLWDSDPRGTRTYNEVAGEFQQFQVLLQRFIENEPFQGPRVQYYIKTRYDLRNLLQVPVIREDKVKDKNKARGREKDEYCITSDMLVEVLEESIRIFWQFVRADRNCASLMVKGRKGTQHQELKALGDLELLMDVKKGLQKKEKKLKDALRGECCILKRLKKHKEDDSDHVFYFFSQVDMKLVTRVLNMSRLTTDQLVWCHNKLSRISFLHMKIHVDPSFLLFPC